MAVKLQLRRGTASQWTSSNPTLAAGELGIETDTSKAKVGDGTTAWNSLPYFAGGGGASSNVFSSNVIIDVSTTDPALRVTQRGTGLALRVEDDTNPDASPFVVDANGKVGIGTDSPNANLDIRGSVLVQHDKTLAFANTTSTGGATFIYQGDDNFVLYNDVGQPAFSITGGTSPTALYGANVGNRLSFSTNPQFLSITVNGSERMRITANGKVGIGTTDPDGEYGYAGGFGLAVRENKNGTTRIGIFNSTTGAESRVGLTRIGATAFSYCNWDLADASGNPFDIFEYGQGVQSVRWYFSSPVDSLAYERMRLDNAGNLSIGVAGTTRKLAVHSSSNTEYTEVAQLLSVAKETGTSHTRLLLEKGSGYGGAISGFIEQGVGGGLALSTLDNGNYNNNVVTIRHSGRVGITMSDPVSLLHVNANTVHTGSEGAMHGIAISTGDNGKSMWFGYDGNTDIGYINAAKNGQIRPIVLQSRGGNVGIGTVIPPEALSVVGNVVATGTITASYSDERLKERLGNVNNSINIIQSLNGFKYKNNDLAKSLGYGGDAVQIGLSAQEVEKVLPEVVSLAPFDMARDEQDNLVSKSGNNYLTLDYSKIVPVLIEAVKELAAEVEKLKREK